MQSLHVLVRQRCSFLIKTIADPVHIYVHKSQIYIKWQERLRETLVSPFILLFPYAILGGRVTASRKNLYIRREITSEWTSPVQAGQGRFHVMNQDQIWIRFFYGCGGCAVYFVFSTFLLFQIL